MILSKISLTSFNIISSHQQVRLLPWIFKQLLQVYFFFAIWTGLLLSNYQPASNTKPWEFVESSFNSISIIFTSYVEIILNSLMKRMAAGQLICIFNYANFTLTHKQLVSAKSAQIFRQ